MKKGTKVALIAGAGLVTGTILFLVLRNDANEPSSSTYPEGTLLRAGSNDKVYYIDAQGSRHWIQTRAKFNSMGLSMSNVKSISSSEMNSIPTGTNIAGLSGVQQLLF